MNAPFNMVAKVKPIYIAVIVMKISMLIYSCIHLCICT